MLTIQKNILKKMLIVLVIVAIFAFLLITNPPKSLKTNAEQSNTGKPIAETQGKQLISITAKAGFTPNSFQLAANEPTILRVSTKNTFDCTSTISIPKLGINKTLPFTGETDIELPAQAAGSKVIGTCSMGMYSFELNFS